MRPKTGVLLWNFDVDQAPEGIGDAGPGSGDGETVADLGHALPCWPSPNAVAVGANAHEEAAVGDAGRYRYRDQITRRGVEAG